MQGKFIDPLTFSCEEKITGLFPNFADMLKGRRSLSQIPGTQFFPTPGFEGRYLPDFYGELPVGLYVLNGGALFGLYGLIVSNTGEFVIEQNCGMTTDVEFLQAVIQSGYTSNKIEINDEDNILPLIGVSSYCFYHWMMESLPKVVLAERTGYTGKYLVPSSRMNKWVSASMEILGIDPTRLVEATENVIAAQRIYIASYFSGFANMENPEMLQMFREAVLAGMPRDSHKKDLRLFVPRKSTARNRRIVNHDEVQTLLERYGFETRYFEDYTLQEQIEMAMNARALVGPHGSGMVHTLFMPRDAFWVELYPYMGKASCSCYRCNAKLLNHEYYAAFSDYDHDSDIFVDVSTLEKKLQAFDAGEFSPGNNFWGGGTASTFSVEASSVPESPQDYLRSDGGSLGARSDRDRGEALPKRS